MLVILLPLAAAAIWVNLVLLIKEVREEEQQERSRQP